MNNQLSIVLSFSLTSFLLVCVGLKVGDFIEPIRYDITIEDQEKFEFRSVLTTAVMALLVLAGLIMFGALFLIEIREERRRASLLSAEDVEVLRKAFLEAYAPTTPSQRTAVEQFAQYLEGPSKFTSDRNDFVMGPPGLAARGIYHFMCVDVLLATDSTRLAAEIRAFVEVVMGLPDEEVLARFADPWEEEPTAGELREKVRREVGGNFHYVVHERSSEDRFHNGVRDQGRSFGQFCMRLTDRSHKAQMRDHPTFFVDPACEVYRAFRPAWDALAPETQQEYSVRLSDFVAHEVALKAGLSEAHVIALRYFTTHAFKYLNNPLRRTTMYYDARRPHPLPYRDGTRTRSPTALSAVRSVSAVHTAPLL